MENELPKTWIEISVGEIASNVQYGYTAKSFQSDDGIRYLRITDIQDEKVDWDSVPSCEIDDDKIDKYLLRKDDIVFARTGATVGKSFLIEEIPYKSVFASYLIRLTTGKHVNPRLIKYFFSSKSYWNQISESASGIGQPNVNASKLKAIRLPLPPLPEQKRIVTKLDKLFGHLEVLKAKLDRIPELLEAFQQSVLTQAVTGKLTKEWRESRNLKNSFGERDTDQMREVKIDLPENWHWLPFKSVAEVKSNLVNPDDYPSLPLIAPDNIESKTGKLISKPLVSDIKPKSAKHYFKSGCIVYSKIRPYLSKVIISDFDGLCSADMYPIVSDIEIKYLFYYMLSEEYLSFANTSGERTVLPKINQKELSIIPVSVPPFEEQKEIIKRIDHLFDKTDIAYSQYLSLQKLLDQLPTTILKEAFNGKLSQQLEEDGTASELISLIKEEKVLQKKKVKNFKIARTEKRILTKKEFVLTKVLKNEFSEKEFTFSQLWKSISGQIQYEDFKRQFFSLIKKDFRLDWDYFLENEQNIQMSFDKTRMIISFKLEA